MAKRKTVQPPDIVNDETGQNSPTPAAQVPTAESPQGVRPQFPGITVSIYPVREPQNNFLASASVTISGCFAARGFSIFRSDTTERGLSVREPKYTYFKNGTRLDRPAFFPVTKEAREMLYGQIMDSYELVTAKERAKQSEGTAWLMGEDEDSPSSATVTAEDDLPFGQEPPGPDIPIPTEEDMPAMGM